LENSLLNPNLDLYYRFNRVKAITRQIESFDIYNEFKDLNGAEPRELARFYEQNHTLIQNLDQHEYFDLQVSYLVALFELGQYDKLLTIVDEPIEACIIHNIQKHNGKDVFRKLLYIKGESSFHLMKFDEAKYIFLELIKMDNKNSFYKFSAMLYLY